MSCSHGDCVAKYLVRILLSNNLNTDHILCMQLSSHVMLAGPLASNRLPQLETVSTADLQLRLTLAGDAQQASCMACCNENIMQCCAAVRLPDCWANFGPWSGA